METKSKTSTISSIKRIGKIENKPKATPALVSKEKKSPITQAAAKAVTPRNKANLVEKVISNREVKYIYPEDVVDTLSRKSWRQKTRDELDKLKLALLDIKDQNSKEYKSALKKLEDLKSKVLKSA